ncbi:MAG: UDP-N-acetyl-D-mannosamine dehydrogenase [Actinomycetaceae bacterium]|nr:UDP-N-acetyl-D-mannosamine dehydrogenase [Actinomycetaceae bacterium]
MNKNVKADKSLTVIGLGYIGLPTAVVFAQNGWRVIGVDVNQKAVDLINQGKLPFTEEGLEAALSTVVQQGALSAQIDTPPSNVYIVSVPTPFKDDHEADLSYIELASRNLAPQLKGGELVVLESTVPVGATQFMADIIKEERPDLFHGEETDLLFAHAPERVLPGRIMIEMTSNDRIIGGLTPEATERAKEVYESFCAGHVFTTDAKTAELSKLAENSFRDVNIAYANELSIICERLGINVWELIELANKHPRVNILQPGPGVGGHCIAVDPWFIVATDRENSRIVATARKINDSKPEFVKSKITQAIRKKVEEGVECPQVALLGLAFKPDIDDLRESPALAIAKDIAKDNKNIGILAVEPNISELPTALADFSNVKLMDAEAATQSADVIVQLVNHGQFKVLEDLFSPTQIIIDTRGTWAVK